jgi:hypothetical protein
MRASMAGLPAGRGPMALLVEHVGAECPGALRGTPLDQTAPQLRESTRAEILTTIHNDDLTTKIEQALDLAAQGPQAAAVKRFVTTAASIRWDNPRIAYLVKTFLEIELQRHRVTQLDVCRAIKEWVASGYQKVPPPVTREPQGDVGRRWMRAVAALGCQEFAAATPRVVLRALNPYQQPGARPTTRDVEVMEIQLSFEEAEARQGAARSLAQVLGLSRSLSKSMRQDKHSKHSPHVLALNAPREPPDCSGRPGHRSEPTATPSSAVGP